MCPHPFCLLQQVHAAPGPEEVNWESLWFNHAQRTFRGWVTTPFAVLVVLLPVSLLTSAISQLNSQVSVSCGLLPIELAAIAW